MDCMQSMAIPVLENSLILTSDSHNIHRRHGHQYILRIPHSRYQLSNSQRITSYGQPCSSYCSALTISTYSAPVNAFETALVSRSNTSQSMRTRKVDISNSRTPTDIAKGVGLSVHHMNRLATYTDMTQSSIERGI